MAMGSLTQCYSHLHHAPLGALQSTSARQPPPFLRRESQSSRGPYLRTRGSFQAKLAADERLQEKCPEQVFDASHLRSSPPPQTNRGCSNAAKLSRSQVSSLPKPLPSAGCLHGTSRFQPPHESARPAPSASGIPPLFRATPRRDRLPASVPRGASGECAAK